MSLYRVPIQSNSRILTISTSVALCAAKQRRSAGLEQRCGGPSPSGLHTQGIAITVQISEPRLNWAPATRQAHEKMMYLLPGRLQSS